MPKTVGQIINFVDQMIPNAVDSTTKMIFIEDIWKDIKEYNTEYVTSDTTPTASTQADYSLPTGVSWRDLIGVCVSATTFNTTNVVGTTTPFVEYLYKNSKNAESGMQWWENSSSSIRIMGIPDDAYHMRFLYLPSLVCNASTDSTTLLPGNSYMDDYVQNKLASQIAKFGAFPRVDLANNYEMEAEDKLTRVKIESKKMKWKRRSFKMSYKEWW
jgi:hypothetical protein